MQTTITPVESYYDGTRFRVYIVHEGMLRRQEIKGDSADEVLKKARSKADEWDRQWAQRKATEQQRADRQAAAKDKAEKQALAAQRSQEAAEQWSALQEVLAHTLRVDDAIDWGAFEDHRPFEEPRPPAPVPVLAPEPPAPLPEPQLKLDEPPGCFGAFLDSLSPSRVQERQAALQRDYESAHSSWVAYQDRRLTEYRQRVEEVEAENQAASRRHAEEVAAQEARKRAFLQAQEAHNADIARRRDRYLSGDADAIREYCEMVLERSEYPDWNPKSWALEYRPEPKLLVVDYELPTPDRLPRLKGVKYVATRNAFEESTYTDAQVDKAYDALLHQIVLRTIHELFEADRAGALELVAFNGRVRSVDRATGKPFEACILSLQAKRSEFAELELSAVDPKACFKKLKGVGSSKLHSLAPVPPIVEMTVEDARFVDTYEVRSTLDEGENIAAMDWEDFEHLIRELFELEFGGGGGQVKVTRASRDGGIDVVVFDPDPLRGGKIVIQAKRYTHTVGVSAVRDLYGALQHEGANKGILVTTSDFGPDAYEFIRDKPLALINGAQLLHLLQKHGHQVRINLVEARQARSAQP